jgi:hypothetical protein
MRYLIIILFFCGCTITSTKQYQELKLKAEMYDSLNKERYERNPFCFWENDHIHNIVKYDKINGDVIYRKREDVRINERNAL